MNHKMKMRLSVMGLSVLIAVSGVLIFRYQKTHQKFSAEIIQVPFSGNDALVSFEDGRLFSFTLPEDAPANLEPGMLVRITGENYMLYSFPAQMPNVRKVEITGKRPNFVEKYYNKFLQKDHITRHEIMQLDDLNEAEKAGLCYLLHL